MSPSKLLFTAATALAFALLASSSLHAEIADVAPDEAQASTAAANLARYPRFFINGMVNEPVVTTLATAEPETVPMKPDATAEALAGPPTR